MKRNSALLFEVPCSVLILAACACAPGHDPAIFPSHPAHPDAPQAKQPAAKPFLVSDFGRALTNVSANAASDGQHEHLHKHGGPRAADAQEESK